MNKTSYILCILAMSSTEVCSQGSLNLFQETDSVPNVENTRRAGNSNISEFAFELSSVSRFGEEYHAILQKNGTKQTIIWEKNSTQSIPGSPGYSVINISSRSVAISYPFGTQCNDNVEAGIECNGDMARLSLRKTKPTMPNQITIEKSDAILAENNVSSPVEPGDVRVSRNPFNGEIQELPPLTQDEIKFREERRARRVEQFQNFEIVRIPDEEVPIGMRVVRTPFGDSLERIEE